MAKELSEKQRSILEFLQQFIVEKDYPPSIRDIQQSCGISSTSVVDYNLKRLEEKGYIRRDREISRAIELTEAGGRRARAVRVPVAGKIAAGQPIPMPPETRTAAELDDYVELTEVQTGGRQDIVARRVEGDSMIEAHIEHGDVVIVERTQSWKDGDIVAVWLRKDDETTLKKLFHEGERIRLQPMHAGMEPFFAAPEDVRVQGRVLAAIRSL